MVQLVCLRGQHRTENAKLHLLWRLFIIRLLNFCKPEWHSNFSKLSDSRVNIPVAYTVNFHGGISFSDIG